MIFIFLFCEYIRRYVARMDADDISLPDRLLVQARATTDTQTIELHHVDDACMHEKLVIYMYKYKYQAGEYIVSVWRKYVSWIQLSLFLHD